MTRLAGDGDRNPYSNTQWHWRPFKDGRWTRPELEDDPGWRAVYFMENFLRHTKGRWAGNPFRLTPVELELVLRIFGTVDRYGFRVARKVWIEWARKNGKSEMAAAVAITLLMADGEAGAEVYGAAVDRDQAGIVFGVAASMVEMSPRLATQCKVSRARKRISTHLDGGRFYQAIAADAAGSHGFNAHAVIFDEVHTQKSRELWDVLETSMGARDQPLMFAITTAGTDRESIAAELHRYADQVQRGVVTDPTWVVDVRNTPEDADWRDEKNWWHANPHMGSAADIRAGKKFRKLEEMRQFAKEAELRPAAQTTFRNLYLNQWTQSVVQWIDLRQWDKGADEWDVEDIDADRPVFVGVDLAATQDVTAVAVLIPWGEYGEPDHARLIMRYFLPRAWVNNRPAHFLSRQAMLEDSNITITEGDVIDFAAVEDYIDQVAQRFRVIELGHDPWQSTMLVQRLADKGMWVASVPQGPSTLTPPTKEFERLVGYAKLHHRGDPVLRWMVDNVTVKTQGDTVRISKTDSAEKIDGVAATINAIERWMSYGTTTIDASAAWLD